MNSNPKVRVIREFYDRNKHYRKGDVFEPWGTYRDVLVAKGYIEVIKPEAPMEKPADVQEAVAAVVAPPVELPRRSKAKK